MNDLQASQIEAFFKTHGLIYKIDLGDVGESYRPIKTDTFKGVIVIRPYPWGFEAGIRDYREHDKIQWQKFGGESLSDADLKELKVRRKETSDKLKADHLEVKALVGRRLDEWAQLRAESPYLGQKKLPTPGGLIVRPDENSNRLITCIPMYDGLADVWNVQQIAPSGGKSFWPGGLTTGLFTVIKGANGSSRVLVGEGYATCLAANLASGLTAYCAFTADNMESVVRVMLERYTPEQIVLLVDWDAGSELKTGLNKGLQTCVTLAMKYRVSFALPMHQNKDLPDDLNVDFADVWEMDLEEVTTALSDAHIKPWEMAADFIKVFEKPIIQPSDETPETPMERESCVIHHPAVDLTEGVYVEQKNLTDTPLLVVAPPDLRYILNPIIHMKDRPDYRVLTKSLMADVGQKGGVKPTLHNFETILTTVKAIVRYNLITKDQEYFLPGEQATTDNYKNAIYGRIIDLCARVGFPTSVIDHYLTYLCDQNAFNPVASWIESKPWDGKSRLQDLLNTITCRDETDSDKCEVKRLKTLIIKKWLLTAIKAAYCPDGVEAAGFLVFQGPQYIGKTRWFLSLVPRELKLTVESKTLDPKDKDSVKQTVCFWLVELGELDATFKKTDVAALKGFLTRGSDMFRPAYAKNECNFPRRTVFFGSVNPDQFLVDPTGNRRFWTLAVKTLNADHGLDMQQLWAEMLALYRAGEAIFPTFEEMKLINGANEAHEASDPFEEKLLNTFDWADLSDEKSSSQIAQLLGYERASRADLMHIAAAVRKLNGGLAFRKSNGLKLLRVGRVRGESPDKKNGIPF